MKSQQPAMMIDEHSNKSWHLDGKLHRTDGPAIEWATGTKEWRLNGKLHRTVGPAVEWANGDKAWCLNGKYHRADGPAVEYTNGNKMWFLNGKKLGNNADGFWVLWKMQKTDEQKATLLFNCGGIPK